MVAVIVHSCGEAMCQVWMSLSFSYFVLLFLRWCIWRSQLFDDDFLRFFLAPLLAFLSASVMGSITATFVLFFGIVWAAGNVGYSLALHGLRKGTEPAILPLPIPSCAGHTIKVLNSILRIAAPIVVLLWTLGMIVLINVSLLTDEMYILMALSYFGWISVGFWVTFVALGPMHGVLLGEWMELLLPGLFPWMIVSPLICFASMFLSVVCHLLLMMALVAYLCYNLAIYQHFLETVHQVQLGGSEDTLHREILGDKTGQMKSDPGLRRNTK